MDDGEIVGTTVTSGRHALASLPDRDFGKSKDERALSGIAATSSTKGPGGGNSSPRTITALR